MESKKGIVEIVPPQRRIKPSRVQDVNSEINKIAKGVFESAGIGTNNRTLSNGNLNLSQKGAQEAVGALIWSQAPTLIDEVEKDSSRNKRIDFQSNGNLIQTNNELEAKNTKLSPLPFLNDRNSGDYGDYRFMSSFSPTPKLSPPISLHETEEIKSKFGFRTSHVLVSLQLFFIFLYGLFVSYDIDLSANPASYLAQNEPFSTTTTTYRSFIANRGDEEGHGNILNENNNGKFESQKDESMRLSKLYPMFQDVHVMIFIGFGFLMTFLKKYGYSAVGFNMLIAAIAIQWSVLCRGLFHHGLNTIPINITSLINGDFAAGAVLITFGALLGVTTPLQLVTLCLIEVFLYALNEYIGAELLSAIDVGGSMWIHTFGAYFGLALSFTLRKAKDIDTKNEGANVTSDIFAMIGTVFLWLFWPSFNGALAVGDDQHRAVLNTVLSLSASCIISFGISSLLSHENKFNMVHIQNASLAGGVAVGAVADLMIRPFGALLIGSCAGLLSTLGYVYLTPLLQRKIGLHDTCGVHNLHGMPGVFAGLIGVFMAAIATENDYGKSLYLQYPARSPPADSEALKLIKQNDLTAIEGGENRSAESQALYQLAALGTTLAISIVGGAATGLLLRIPFFGKVPNEGLFNDSHQWEVPEDEEKEVGVTNGQKNSSYGTLGVNNPGMEMTQEKGSA